MILEKSYDEALALVDDEINNRSEHKLTIIDYYRAHILERTERLDLAKELAKQLQTQGGDFLTLGGISVEAYVSWKNGDLELTENLIEKGSEILSNLDESTVDDPKLMKNWESTLYNLHGNVMWRRGNSDKAIELHKKSLIIRIEYDLTDLISFSLNNLATIYYTRGELDIALDYFENALDHTTDEDDEIKATIFSNIGAIYSNYGNLDMALEYNTKAYEIREKINNERGLGYSLNNIGTLHLRIGNLDKALEYLFQSYDIRMKYKNPESLGTVLSNIAKAYHYLGEYTQSLKYLDQSLENYLQHNNPLNISAIYFWYIQVYLALNQIEKAKIYHEKLDQLKTLSANPLVSDYAILATVKILQKRGRVFDLAKAQEALEKFLEKPSKRYYLTKIALITQIEILIQELTILDDYKEAIEETLGMLNNLYKKAQEQHSFSLAIETMILRAKLYIIQGDLGNTLHILDQAEINAEEKEIFHLLEKIKIEKENVHKNIEKWQHLVESSFVERLEHSKIKDYLRDISSII